MKIKIVSDGSSAGTYIETETGERLEGVVGVRWSIDVANIAQCTVEFVKIPVEVESVNVSLIGDIEALSVVRN